MRTGNPNTNAENEASPVAPVAFGQLEDAGWASDGSRVFFSVAAADGRRFPFVCAPDTIESVLVDLQRLADGVRTARGELPSESHPPGTIVRTCVREVDEARVDIALDGQCIALSLKSGAIWSRFALVPHGCARLAEVLTQNYREWRNRHARH